MELACLSTFVQAGHQVTLYTFDASPGAGPVADGVEWRAAGEILDSSYLKRFITNGRPNIAHFADLFRLKLFERTGKTWIDADMLCRERVASEWPSTIVVQERSQLIINCVLRLDDPAVVAKAEALTMQLLDRDLPWAATQSILATAVRAGREPIQLKDYRVFCPISADDWAMLLLPEHRDQADLACSAAKTVHIYNNILQKVGYLKDALPPPGSWLRAALEERGLAHLFKAEYPADVVRQLAEGWVLRFNAGAAGFGAILRQSIPSLRRTLSRRMHR